MLRQVEAQVEAVLPRSRNMDWKLLKNLLEAESCCTESWKLEGVEYVSRVSPEEVSKSSEFWIIPHHVVHLNRKDSVFFDCIFCDLGQSVNKLPLLRVPLFSVLLRFHQNSVIMSGRHQGHVPSDPTAAL